MQVKDRRLSRCRGQACLAPTDSLQRAINYACTLLKYRQRSLRELRLRLDAKGFDPKDIEGALVYLLEKKFVEKDCGPELDAARKIARERRAALKNCPAGKIKSRLTTYLARRGFDAEVIVEAIENM